MRNEKGTSSVGDGSGLKPYCRVDEAEKTLDEKKGDSLMVCISALGTCDATGVVGRGKGSIALAD
jgi:hypothetical protein